MNTHKNYAEFRDQIKNGDIAFICNGGTKLHRLISFFTKSTHIHVGILFWVDVEGEQHLMISEAQGGAQRRIINMSYYQNRRIDVLRTEHDWSEIKHKALEHIGQVEYNWIEAGYIGLSELVEHTFNKPLPYIQFTGEICSEFVANVLELDRNYLSPAKLYRYMTENLGYKKRCELR